MPTNVGNTPPDFTIPLGQLRGLIGDFEAIPLVPPVLGQGEYMWFGDDVLQGFLNVYNDNPRRAAAQALRTIASSQALLLKKWSADDLSVDGPAISEALRRLAGELDSQVDNEQSTVDIFELVELGGTVEYLPEFIYPPTNSVVIYGRHTYTFTTLNC
jgi:hypothetical protein